MDANDLEQYRGKPYPYFRGLFSGLQPPSAGELKGTYRASFTGPLLLRKTAGPAIALGGMPGWWGKDFTGDGRGVNLLKRREGLLRVFPFTLEQAVSLVDSKPGLAVRYNSSCPFPWNHVLDELRWLGESYLLGMTVIDAGPLRKLAFPFILQLEERPYGQ